MTGLVSLIDLLFTLYAYMILARIILSWIRVNQFNPWVRLLVRVTEPFLAPFRVLIPSFGGLDFSPIVAFLVLQMLRTVMVRLLIGI